MAATRSKMLALGTLAPPFSLPDTEGNQISLAQIRGSKGTLIFFICNHCPYVIHIRKELAKLSTWALKCDVGVAGINSNDSVNYPDDAPEKMRSERNQAGYPFAYLYDETQSTAKNYQAACTPDFYLFDKELKLVYRGQFDDSRPGNGVPVTGKDLRNALECLMEGRPIPREQRPSLGCNIKWKPGNEPSFKEE